MLIIIIVRDRWLDWFLINVGRLRDIYEIVDPHTENFSDAYAYLGALRWWYELIGYWGPPGKPPLDEKAPAPIIPINVPTLSSQEAYMAAYPKGLPHKVQVSVALGIAIARRIKK
jgi:hypothetical protein